MKPATLVIKKFNGASILAKLLDVDISTISQWEIRNGRVPSSQQIKVLKLAKKMGIELTAHEVIYGSDA